MTQALLQWFRRLETQKQKVLSGCDAFSASQLCQHPQAGDWSIAQVVSHLAKTESIFVFLATTNLSKNSPVTLTNRIAGLMIITAMKLPVRVKVPAAASAILPKSNCDAALSSAEWTQARARLKDLLEDLQPQQMRVGVFNHPVSGWMTVLTALEFLSAHIRHHEFQIERLKLRLQQT